MTNIEYLKECRKARDEELKALDTIETSPAKEKMKVELRKIYALEIIAEELCKLNEREVDPLEAWNNRKGCW